EAKNVAHRVEAGLLAVCPQRRFDRPMRKELAIFGMVGQDDALASAGQNHRVIADYRTAPQRGKADRAFLAWAGVTIANPHALLGKIDLAAARNSVTQQKSGSGRRVHLVTMMHLKDFDVEIARCKRLC